MIRKLTALFSIALILFSFAPLSAVAGTSNNVSGYGWSSNIGWISLNNCSDPMNSSTCSGPDYGVNFPETDGAVTGYAWSSNIGWITFTDSNCPSGACGSKITWTGNTATVTGWARVCAVYQNGCSGPLKTPDQRGEWDGYISLSGTGYGVVVNADKTISGFAWGSDVVGWIKFRGLFNTNDVCPNITGSQSAVPQGMVLNTNNECVPLDVCPNIAGDQQIVPPGLVLQGGQCVTPGDMCPNIAGLQTSVPSGMVINGNGDCVIQGADVCSNLPGTQIVPPAGMTAADGVCTGPNGDICMNLTGVQVTPPQGYQLNGSGQCTIKPKFIES